MKLVIMQKEKYDDQKNWEYGAESMRKQFMYDLLI